MPDRNDTVRLQAELDRCVKCGMCLPECPTYRLDADENESPRGRLALIEGLVSGRLTADEPLARHLENCLGCRRCERVCPSLVRYGHLIDQGRGRVAAATGSPGPAAWQQRPAALQWATRAARALPEALSRPLGRLHRLHRLARSLPAGGPAPAPGIHRSGRRPTRGLVGLFVGCTGAAQQGGALRAAVALLGHCGFDVQVPERATCCGAQSRHAGDAATADRFAAATRAVFDAPLDAVVSIASGCGNQLDEYHPPLAVPHRDICRFLLDSGGLDSAAFHPLAARVLLHTPCSVENVYRGSDWAPALLARVPGLEVVRIGEPGQCCGAAGDYMLRHPEAAGRLREPLLEQAMAADGAVVATSNVGCAMHLAEGLADSPLAVRHPVEILAGQLRTEANEGGAGRD